MIGNSARRSEAEQAAEMCARCVWSETLRQKERGGERNY